MFGIFDNLLIIAEQQAALLHRSFSARRSGNVELGIFQNDGGYIFLSRQTKLFL